MQHFVISMKNRKLLLVGFKMHARVHAHTHTHTQRDDCLRYLVLTLLYFDRATPH